MSTNIHQSTSSTWRASNSMDSKESFKTCTGFYPAGCHGASRQFLEICVDDIYDIWRSNNGQTIPSAGFEWFWHLRPWKKNISPRLLKNILKHVKTWNLVSCSRSSYRSLNSRHHCACRIDTAMRRITGRPSHMMTSQRIMTWRLEQDWNTGNGDVSKLKA